MLTLFHAPNARSSRIVTLIDEMGIGDWVTISPVSIVRFDGSGQVDPDNPHPEGKVPLLDHDGVLIRESTAIILHLTGLFPDAGMAPAAGTAAHGAYLAWICWYGAVMEPVMTLDLIGVDHPILARNLRGVAEVTGRLEAALSTSPYLLGDAYSAADLLVHSFYVWMPNKMPDSPAIRDWVARCNARPSVERTRQYDARLQLPAMA
jgi:glutathione S-transferase